MAAEGLNLVREARDFANRPRRGIEFSESKSSNQLFTLAESLRVGDIAVYHGERGNIQAVH
jgi:hypothetical protein